MKKCLILFCLSLLMNGCHSTKSPTTTAAYAPKNISRIHLGDRRKKVESLLGKPFHTGRVKTPEGSRNISSYISTAELQRKHAPGEMIQVLDVFYDDDDRVTKLAEDNINP